MSRLTLRVLGPPRIQVDDNFVTLPRRKAMALLAYLAVTQQPNSRDALATLFWPGYGQAEARGHLRRALTSLRRNLGPEWFETDRHFVALSPSAELWIDVEQFRALLARTLTDRHLPDDIGGESLPALEAAVALYTDDFLAGFTLPDCPDFDAWQRYQTETQRAKCIAALARLSCSYAAQGDTNYRTAIEYARRWVTMDPLHEPAHRQLMQIYAWTGQQAAALHQYQECARVLQEELGVPPSAKTTDLCNRIRYGVETSRDGEESTSLSAALQPAPLPQVISPLEKLPVVDEIRQVVALNLVILDWSEERQTSTHAQQITRFRTAATTTLQRFAAHVEHIGADGVAAVFGVPYSHEDDAERAVSAAIALRQAALQCNLQIAIGIKIGLAQVERSEQREITTSDVIYSAALGQAAELQRAAVPGQIIVDRATYLRTRTAFAYTDVSITLRGRPQPTVGYLVMQAKPAITKTRGIPGHSSELIGREFELAVLERAVQHLTTGVGQVVLLVGEAGIGKSRLVREVWQRRPQHCLWLEGRCLEMTTPISYWPFQQALQGYFGWQTNDDETTQASSIRVGLEKLVAAQLLNEEAGAEIGAVLGKLASLRFGNAWDARLENATPAECHQRMMTALRTLLTALTQFQPLVLTLEDLHWSDDASLDLLSELLSTVEGTPLLLLCVYRPLAQQRCVQLPTLAARRCPGHYQELVLYELTPTQIQQMIGSLLQIESLTSTTKQWVLSHAQGNPYFTEELILSLIEAGIIRQQEGVWRTDPQLADDIETLDLPYSIDHLILSRFDRLNAPVRQILEAAAVLGRSFLLPILNDLVPHSSDVDSVIYDLEERGFIYCEHRQPVAEFSFRHVLGQQAIYQILSDEQRSHLHLRAVQAIEQRYSENLDAQVEILAYHAVCSGNHAKAARYLVDAGTKARRTFANETAIAYFHQALDNLARIGDVQDERKSAAAQSDVWNQLGRCYHATGRYQLAEQAFRQAITQGEAAHLPAAAIVRMIHWLGEALYWQNKYAELRDSSLAGLALLPPDSPSVEQIFMLSHLDAAHFALGEIAASRAAARRIIPIIAQFPLVEELWPAYHSVIDYCKDKKEAGQALAWIEILRSKAAERQEQISLARAAVLRGVTLSEMGDLHGAQPVLQEALALSQRIGETAFQYQCLHRFAINALMLGEKERAGRYVDELLALMQTFEPATPDQYAFCGHILLGAGQVERGLALLSQAFADCQSAGAQPIPEHRLWLGHALVAAGRHEEAKQHFQQLLESSQSVRHLIPDYPDLPHAFPAAVAALDALLEEPLAFQQYCEQLRRDPHRPELHHTSATAFRYWHPVTTEIADKTNGAAGEPVSDAALAAWQWCDPLGDGAYQIDHGVEITAADARDLRIINLSAPSLRTCVEGNFVLSHLHAISPTAYNNGWVAALA